MTRAALDDAKLAQRRAADPRASVWVSANAGSGKTHVLVDRVTRLLLDGAAPGTILCLTYTKAAAAEMRARLAERLGRWAAADDATLTGTLTELADGGVARDGAMRLRARRLFAEVLDAPGGMRVQTIHSFCESLLRRFPLEAGLSVQFAIADDADTAELLAQARGELLASAGQDAVVGGALADNIANVDSSQLDDALDSLARDARRLRRLLAQHGGDPERAIAALAHRLGVAPDDTRAALDAAFIAGIPRDAMARAQAALAAGSVTDQDRSAALAVGLAAADPADAIDDWLQIFLTKTDLDPRKSLGTKAIAKAAPAVVGDLFAEQARCVAHLERRRAIGLFCASAAMTRLGARLLARYDDAKRARALLDYDDLILRSLALLDDIDHAWVRFKLDGGIDHILVDEAQDTSGEQWRLIGALAAEFFAGEGARGDRVRTLFAVGDEKQSIFSFQGAEPAAFGAARDAFARAATEAAGRFEDVALAYSFRSTPTVLDAVDALFAGDAARAGVADAPPRHSAVRAGEPGLVELWPLFEPPAAVDAPAWDVPLDYVSVASPQARLAGAIATTIKGWLMQGEALAASGAPIRAGDVMILVRRRGAFFEEMVRALKANDVPVAGADRLVLADHIAIQDLIALGRFLSLPQDEYALACALKSPLFGFDDDDLFALCHGRRERLWPSLRARADERPAWRAAVDQLARLLRRADFVPPFELFAELLGAAGGRRRFLARLGAEAADPLDEFLARALAFERDHPPSLEAFLHWLAQGGAEIKRDMEQARDEVRVMTVHAAKGLEAPIVFLPDTASARGARAAPELLWPEHEQRALMLWPAHKGNHAALYGATRDESETARLAEYRRLLYVATTRARDRLYVCGWRGVHAPGDGTWHALLEQALRAHPAIRAVERSGIGAVLRLAPDETPAPRTPRPPAAPAISPDLPSWLRRAAPIEPRPPRPLAPSAMPVAEAPAGRISGPAAAAARRGRALHRLFELLPELAAPERLAVVRRLIAHGLPELDAEGQRAVAEECLAAIALAPDLFGPQSRAEVAVAGLVGRHPVAGQIDRLVVRQGEVLIVDFKSSRLPPQSIADVPPAHVMQLALYRACLQPIYRDHVIRGFLLWTAAPLLMELPATQLDAALISLQVPDPKGQ